MDMQLAITVLQEKIKRLEAKEIMEAGGKGPMALEMHRVSDGWHTAENQIGNYGGRGGRRFQPGRGGFRWNLTVVAHETYKPVASGTQTKDAAVTIVGPEAPKEITTNTDGEQVGQHEDQELIH